MQERDRVNREVTWFFEGAVERDGDWAAELPELEAEGGVAWGVEEIVAIFFGGWISQCTDQIVLR